MNDLSVVTKSERWQKIMEEWEASGLTQNNYCIAHGLNMNCFTYWRSRLKKDKELLESARKGFVSVALVERSETGLDKVLSLHLRSGRWVKIPKGFDEETLQQVLRCADV